MKATIVMVKQMVKVKWHILVAAVMMATGIMARKVGKENKLMQMVISMRAIGLMEIKAAREY